MRSPLGALLMLAAVHAAAADTAAAAEAEPPRFGLPIACELGVDCFVQSHVDLDPGPGAHDHSCGAATYDGHKGTDFRILSAAAAKGRGVGVRAAAAGRVLRARGAMEDVLLRDRKARGLPITALKGRYCGNGVVIDHGDGWETQYCHLKQGSLVVRAGDEVLAGQVIGRVGYSGYADFAHVHFEVRHNAAVLDPFKGISAMPACETDRRADETDGQSLWRESIRETLTYRTGVLIDVGFSERAVNSSVLERNHRATTPRRDSSALIFFARAINLVKGDRIRLKIHGPGGFDVERVGKAFEASKATWVSFAGKRRKTDAWLAGRYVGEAKVERVGKVVSTRRRVLDLK